MTIEHVSDLTWDLQTQFTVELVDDLASYRPDPAECL